MVGSSLVGIIKRKFTSGNVWITPTIEDAVLVEQAGADFIAADATGRKDPLHAKDGWEYLKEICMATNIPVIGDMAYAGFLYKNIYKAEECGCELLSTTLSGYTEYCNPMIEPDFDFLKCLITKSSLPTIAEGRYYTRTQIRLAKEMGARNIVIGSAITRPHLITEKYKEYFNEI